MTGTTTTTLRLTPAERAALDAAASAAGLGPCSYARREVMKAAGRDVAVRRKPVEGHFWHNFSTVTN